MKTVLGLDLGTNSIGWALVKEASNDKEKSSIVKLGVRVIQYDTFSKIDKSGKVSESKNPIEDFATGKGLSPNAARTLKRGARRNLQRYKLRRKNLLEILLKNNIIQNDTALTEVGKDTTHQTLKLRAKSAKEKVELEEFARILLAINKKRGYKSSRKVSNEDEGQVIDGMSIAKELYEREITPGQYVLELLNNGKKYIPDFYRSDLQNEFDAIWEFQKQFYPDILDDNLYNSLKNQGKQNTQKRFLAIKQIYTAENKGSRDEKKIEAYGWRANAIKENLTIEQVAFVLVEINNELKKSSGYLGAISDRSKELLFNKLTVGEYLYNQIHENPHTSLKSQVFYRQDYLDEFEKIWEIQAKFYSVLTKELKEQVRDVIIFYQRKLKSQKGLVSFCQFESWEIDNKDKYGELVFNKLSGLPKKITIGQKVIPKSSPLFQEFKIWQNINNLEFRKIKGKQTNDKDFYVLDEEDRNLLFQELNVRGKLTEKELFKLLGLKSKEWKTNYTESGLEGNRTNEALYNIYQAIALNAGYGHDWNKKNAKEIKEELEEVFPSLGINVNILNFDALIEGNEFEKQESYQLWHLLYSIEEDDKVSKEDRLIYGNNSVTLKKNLCKKFGFTPEQANLLASVSLQDDYGNLSTKAIRKIMPYLAEGMNFYEASKEAGYNHSNSLSKEDNDKRVLKNKLDILPKNSLRNPVVEKILNQVINLVNQVVDKYGKPDEIRIELARELKKSAKEKADAVKFINSNTSLNEDVRNIIKKEFGFVPTRNDVIRYKLWMELKDNNYKSLFTNKYISKDKIFSKEIDIEHIIPKALLFDDSFSNKTLAYRNVNLKKGDRTAIDFITEDYASEKEQYLGRVESLYQSNAISRGKYKKLQMTKEKLPEDFIERDLRNSQYIAKKAKSILQDLIRNPIVSTTGRITDELRNDWDLVNVMKELNLPKYRSLGLTEKQTRWDVGQEKEKEVEVISSWTKRNDHRHHAMDALTVAFTTHNHIQYINNLSARKNQNSDMHKTILNVEKKIKHKNENGKNVFISPMPNFRKEAKRHIESILISFKPRNKVVTQNINKTSKKKGVNEKIQLTPRGQMHKETVYGKIKRPLSKPVKISKKLNLEQAELIIDKQIRQLVLDHLLKYRNDPTKAFDTKTLKKDPIVWNNSELKHIKCFEEIFTIRKDIGPDLKIDKVIDPKIKSILQNRIKEMGSAKDAFTDIEKNPIWINKDKGICIKRVTITGVSNAEALHSAKDHFGKEIIDEEGSTKAVDFVSTGNNHHVAIYEDENGDLHEEVVPFYEAVARVNANLPIINKEHKNGWRFLFTLKQNEMFIFPNEEKMFDPNGIDLEDEKNYYEISPNLFRVQKIGSKDYWFRHHLEATLNDIEDVTYKRKRNPKSIGNIIKVRLNHLGEIVRIGEY
ncbi:MAG: type II CRISPR RNA-guided endonuclease Cas9 [Fluviicola sp.]|nr:MAG: type II CRISPR RNA-guided endonuclease Cas9 [Fluviicola sp.]